MLGSLALALTGAALATMSSEQLLAMRPGAGSASPAPPVRLAEPQNEAARTEAQRESG
jgi:hypothetical protein